MISKKVLYICSTVISYNLEILQEYSAQNKIFLYYGKIDKTNLQHKLKIYSEQSYLHECDQEDFFDIIITDDIFYKDLANSDLKLPETKISNHIIFYHTSEDLTILKEVLKLDFNILFTEQDKKTEYKNFLDLLDKLLTAVVKLSLPQEYSIFKVFDKMPGVVFLFDNEDRLVNCNEAFEKLTDLNLINMQNKTIDEIIEISPKITGYRTYSNTYLKSMYDQEVEKDTEFTLLNGETVIFMTRNFLLEENGTFYGKVFSLTDITSHYEFEKQQVIQKELTVSLNIEEDLDKALEKFIKTVLSYNLLDYAVLYDVDSNSNKIEKVHTGLSDFTPKSDISGVEIPESSLKDLYLNQILYYSEEDEISSFSFLDFPDDYKSMIVIPVHILGKLKAIITIFSRNMKQIPLKNQKIVQELYNLLIPVLTKIHYSTTLSTTLHELNSIFENSSVGIILIHNGKITRANSKFLSTFGYNWTDIKKLEIFKLFENEDNARNFLYDNLILNIKQKGSLEYKFKKKNKELIWCQVSGRFVAPNNPALGTVWIVEDISRRKEVEINNIKNQKQLDAVLSALPDRMLIVDREAKILSMHYRSNSRHLKDFSDYYGKNLETIMPRQRKERVMKAVERCLDKNRLQIIEYSFLKKGSRYFFEARIAPIFLERQGEAQNAVILIRDITARSIIQLELERLNKNLEQEIKNRTKEIIDLNKNAIIGDLVAGFVHNLRSPLSVIRGKADLLLLGLERKKEKKELKEFVEKTSNDINHGVDRIESMLKNLMIKKRNDSVINKTNVCINDFVQREVEFLQADMTFKHKVIKEFEFADNLPEAYFVVSEVSQVFYNLINNAMDAMWQQKNKKILFKTGYEDGMVTLCIIDNGPGIHEENMDKLFNPFFTTKPAKDKAKEGEPTGTGLGLHSARQMMKSNNGDLNISSKLGVGTSVKLSFSTSEN